MFYLACSGREDNRLALLYGYLEVSGHPEIFGVGDTSFKVLDVFDAVVPVGVADPFGFLAELHVQRRESGIQTEAYAVVHFGEVLVEAVVLYHQVVGFAECKERAELERGVGVGVDKSVSDEDTVFLRDKYGFFGKNHTHLRGMWCGALSHSRIRGYTCVRLDCIHLPDSGGVRD